MDLLRPRDPQYQSIPGDRCLKLSVLRLLRAIVSFNDELYNRHIIQHNLFAPVFEAFRNNPVGDNLVSSAIVEMCDFILTEKITSLMEYIVTRFLSGPENGGPSLEDVSIPYVSTLTNLRQAYDNNLARQKKKNEGDEDNEKNVDEGEGSRYFLGNNIMNRSRVRRLSGQALEDQRKFREVDEEQSYFEMDDGDEDLVNSRDSQPTVPALPLLFNDSVRPVENELHRTPRMFSLTDASLMNSIDERTEEHIADTGRTTSGCGDGDELV
jgi:protein phosphatase-4 regulatory subunit 3